MKHKELIKLLEPLIEHMDNNGYSYFLVAGKNGTCSRYMKGNMTDVTYMLTGMAQNNDGVKSILENAINEMN